MEIERLKEDIRNVEYDLEYGEEQCQGRIAVNVNCLRSAINLANEAIARQSVKSEDVQDAIEYLEPVLKHPVMSGGFAKHLNTAIAALQTYQLPSAIKWTGDNLREVISMTGWNESASSKWTWEEYEQVVKEKGLKIFTPDGAVIAAIGSWIVRDGNDCHVLQEYQPWVSVEDRPRKDNKYLAVLQFYKEPKDKTIEVVEYYGEWKVNYEWNVICYKPLPEPPKGE